MLRKLIVAGACLGLMSGNALAQAAPSQSSQPLTIINKPLFKPPPNAAAPAGVIAPAFTKSSGGQILASGFLGKTVYSSDSDDAETIGELDDLVIGPDGMVQAAVIGVGGFLGVGEKDVAVPPEQLKLSRQGNGKSWLVLKATRDQLNAAPAFDRAENFTEGIADPVKTAPNPAEDAPTSPTPVAPK